MVRKGPRTLMAALTASYPDMANPGTAIQDGHVEVDGMVVRNPRSVVGPASVIRVHGPTVLRGEAKLGPALDRFGIACAGRVALDVGAAAGGFTRALLDRGARRVYAVDAGHGQLLGSLRQDPRVVNLEATNLGALDARVVPDLIELFTIDLSYLSLTDAVPQLERVGIEPNAEDRCIGETHVRTASFATSRRRAGFARSTCPRHLRDRCHTLECQRVDGITGARLARRG